MIPKFRAYNPATNDWYKPEEVFVSDGNIYLDDDDFDELTQNNDVTLMQSTGLFDKNGKEIFEGDVVELHHFTEDYHMAGGFYEGEEILVGVIRYGYTDIEIKNIGKVYPPNWLLKTRYRELSFSHLYGVHEESFEIIGNVYENPELVEVE